jgi:hypothetical protein
MSRALRDPRIRLLVATVIVVLAIALSWHLVAMGLHGVTMMLGFCVAILAVVALFLPGLLVARVVWLPLPVPVERTRGERVEPLGRHPPEEGTRLRR